MIYIEQHSHIPEQESVRVASPTGEYEDTSLVAFYDISNPGLEIGSYQAQYVKYGPLIYKFNDPKELGAEILKIDPESRHAAAVFVRMSNELLAQMSNGKIEDTTLDEIMDKEGIKRKDPTLDKVNETTIPIVSATAVDPTLSTTTPVTAGGDRNTPSDPEPRLEPTIDGVVQTLDETAAVIDSVHEKARSISRTAEKISDIVETMAK